ncbi:hypothetical protein [Streptomyces sp. NPDC049813]|uniref:hypothetical protein n=1 Tax=Streptomyces sp. NPDC049813 TaxID=3365597 RepID=UPI0037971AD4
MEPQDHAEPGNTPAAQRLAAFWGDLETHLTVGTAPGAAEGLARWAAARGLGFTHIVLARGRHRSQPMVTLRGRGRADEWTAGPVARIAGLLAEEGFTVLRTKTESAPWATGVPVTDAQARLAPAHLHFEHHVKLLVDPGRDPASLAARLGGHTAHVSWNARRVRDDGRHERFVTQRCHGVGRTTAGRRLDALLAALSDEPGIRILEHEREYVLHDSRLGLDAGWITEGTAS